MLLGVFHALYCKYNIENLSQFERIFFMIHTSAKLINTSFKYGYITYI